MRIYRNRRVERFVAGSAWLAQRVPLPRGLVTLSMLFADFELDFEFHCRSLGIVWSARGYPDKLTRHLLFDGTYQPEVLAALGEFLRPGATFFDVGAHHGLMSVVGAKIVGPSGRVVAFEPNPEARHFLELHLRMNSLENVRIEPLGVMNRSGILDFYPQRGSRTYNSSFVRDFVDPEGRIQPLPIEVVSIDEYVTRSERVPDLIKVDVEGADLEVLKSARETLSRHHPVLCVEYNRNSLASADASSREMTRFLREHGYQFFSVANPRARHDRIQLQPLEEPEPAPGAEVMNVICLPR